MKFIHCADLHLDSKMDGLSSDKAKIRRAEIVNTFENLCNYATLNGVTAVIIAGDMFDTAKVTIKTRNSILHAMAENPSVDFLYLSGNHDEQNFISSLDALPENLKVFNDEWTYFNYGNVCIAGVRFTAYNQNNIYDTLNLLPQNLNVAVLHGQIAGYVGDENSEIISLPRLKDKNIDYLALGHIHQYAEGQLDLRGKYAYSGCLEGRGFDETGDKGFILIDVDKEINFQFVKFSQRNMVNFEYDITNKPDWLFARTEILNYLSNNVSNKNLVKVIIKGQRKPSFDIDILGLSIKLNQTFFFAKVYDKTEIQVEEADYLHDKSLRGEFVRTVWESALSLEEKTKVLTLGLNALKGEEI